MHAQAHLLAVLTWNPGLHAILLIFIAIAVLMGTSYLILSTNVGSRLGLLVCATAAAGVLTLLSVVWMLYGLGYEGRPAAWQVTEITTGSPKQAATKPVRTLPLPDALPDPKSLIEKYHLQSQFTTQKREINLSDVAGASTKAQAQLEAKTGGWRLLPTSAKTATDASNTASQYLTTESTAPKFTDTNGFVVLGTYDKGGKPPLGNDQSLVARALYKAQKFGMWLIADNPTHYAVVQIQPSITQVAQPGQAPPVGVADPSAPVYNVVMVRDLGSIRQPSFAVFVFSAIALAFCLTTLHRRDKVAMALRAAPKAEPFGGLP